MSLLPLPSRMPARKHLLAGSLVLLSLSLMAAAVLGATGLPSPFRSGGADRVTTDPVIVNAPTTTTTAPESTLQNVPPADVSGGGLSSPPRGSTGTSIATGGDSATTVPGPTTSTTVVPGVDDLLDQLPGQVRGGRGQGGPLGS